MTKSEKWRVIQMEDRSKLKQNVLRLNWENWTKLNTRDM